MKGLEEPLQEPGSWQGAIRDVSASASLPVMELRQVGVEAASLLAGLHYAAFAGHEHWDERAFAQILAMPGVVACLACVGESTLDQDGAMPDQGKDHIRSSLPASGPGHSDSPGEMIPAGFIVSRHVVDEGEIVSLGVHPHWRRRGLAWNLLHHVTQQARQRGETLFLEVRAGNHGAARLYEQAGFRQVAIRPRYYDDGEDARLLRCQPGEEKREGSVPSNS